MWIAKRHKAKGDITLDELANELDEIHEIKVHRVSVWRFIRSFGLTYKKTLLVNEQKRPNVSRARHFWITRRQLYMKSHLEKLIFIDETSVKTNMIKTTGCALGHRRDNK